MTKLQWAGVIAALGIGIVAQIPERDHDKMAGHNHGDAMDMGEMPVMNSPAGATTVTLNVTGMT
ncbi:MAG: hypothetical protein ACE5HT_05520 [Gemmatimonadales bacterium]